MRTRPAFIEFRAPGPIARPSPRGLAFSAEPVARSWCWEVAPATPAPARLRVASPSDMASGCGHAGRPDARRPRSSPLRRPAWNHRVCIGQRTCSRGGRSARGGDAPAGLQHCLVDGVQSADDARFDQRRPVRCRQACRPRNHRRRPGESTRVGVRARLLDRGHGLDRARHCRARPLGHLHRSTPHRHRARWQSHLRSGGRRSQRTQRRRRLRSCFVGRDAGRAPRWLAGGRTRTGRQDFRCHHGP